MAAAEARWAVEDIVRHPAGSEWKLLEHIGGPEDDWRAVCLADHFRPGYSSGEKEGSERVFHREYMDRTFTRIRACPDGGACHHECSRDECFRVQTCLPLSGYGEDWKPEDIERFGNKETGDPDVNRLQSIASSLEAGGDVLSSTPVFLRRIAEELDDPLVRAFARLDPSQRQGLFEMAASEAPEIFDKLLEAVKRFNRAAGRV